MLKGQDLALLRAGRQQEQHRKHQAKQHNQSALTTSRQRRSDQKQWVAFLNQWQRGGVFCLAKPNPSVALGEGDLVFVATAEGNAILQGYLAQFPTQFAAYAAEKFKEKGPGIISIVHRSLLEALGMKSQGTDIEFIYLNKAELVALPDQSILLNNAELMRPFLLFAIAHYDPETEINLVLCSFPFLPEKLEAKAHLCFKAPLPQAND